MDKAIEKKDKMNRLLEVDLFNELILNDFIKEGILDNSINNSLDSEHTVDHLKARQILHRYIFDIITSGEITENQQ